MIPIRVILVTLTLAVSHGLASSDDHGSQNITYSFGITPGRPTQTPAGTKSSQCVDTCFTNAATDVGCDTLNNVQCICSALKTAQFLPVVTACIEQSCPQQLGNVTPNYERLCGQPGSIPPGLSPSVLPTIPASGSTIVTFSSSAGDGDHAGTDTTRTVPSATASPTTVTVSASAGKAASTGVPSAGVGNTEKAGDGVNTAAPASDGQDVSGTGDMVTQTVTDQVSSNTSAPGAGLHGNAGARVEGRTAVGFLLGGLCGFLGIASML
ncbi:hypothetical protein GY45DRAFT_134111 [Cubamyces sp. BRFM 1775]|nr:hypothetical protein GY45DRAFT_134111 [Cubamyces sp. BRFM 1775]